VSALPDAARELLVSGRIAYLVTLNRDGSPQMTAVWVGLDGDEIVSGHLFDQRKLRNVRRDPRVSIAVEGDRIHPPGLKEHLIVYGRARIEEGGAPELLQRLARVYLAPDVKSRRWTIRRPASRSARRSSGSPASGRGVRG
jgi:PPOX class probable F420-dependent enzyme